MYPSKTDWQFKYSYGLRAQKKINDSFLEVHKTFFAEEPL